MTRRRPAADQVSTPRLVSDLVADPENRRTHPARNLGMVAEALQHVGAARSIVIDEANVVLAGNGVTAAAHQAGITRVRVVDAAGDELIAVRRTGLTPEQKRALAIYDNRTAELAEWDFERLAADKAAGLSLQPFWTEQEERALGRHLQKFGAGLADPEVVPEVRETTIQRGDLFQLGRHRLLCGDATAAADVARLLDGARPGLMVTDPPYGVNYDPTWRTRAAKNRNTKKLGKVTNDNRADWREAWALFPGDVAYVWHAGTKASIVEASLAACGFEIRAQIVWAKDRMVLSRGDYHPQHEPCWYAVRKGSSGERTDDRGQTTLWQVPAREDSGHSHGTQKPIECMRRPIANHLIAAVYDPFAGSGTTILAAETCDCTCFALEIEPSYAQVICDRWQAATGIEPVRL